MQASKTAASGLSHLLNHHSSTLYSLSCCKKVKVTLTFAERVLTASPSSDQNSIIKTVIFE